MEIKRKSTIKQENLEDQRIAKSQNQEILKSRKWGNLTSWKSENSDISENPKIDNSKNLKIKDFGKTRRYYARRL